MTFSRRLGRLLAVVLLNLALWPVALTAQPNPAPLLQQQSPVQSRVLRADPDPVAAAIAAQERGVEEPDGIDLTTVVARPGSPFTDEAQIRPFGASMFDTQIRGVQGPNSDYIIQAGDRIDVQLFGAINQPNNLVVDINGNIYLPNVGPVRVEGVRSSQLNGVLEQAVSGVYADSVQVYSVLGSAQNISVFVTGEVQRPGSYQGSAFDSVLFYISQAGGIAPNSGSYREIRVTRDDRTIAEIDLYAFLLRGEIAKPQFRQGDTIIVGQRGASVVVEGEVAQTARFEFIGQALSGSDLVTLARPEPRVANVAVTGARSGRPFNTVMPLEEFRSTLLYDGDQIRFQADRAPDSIFVRIEAPGLEQATYSVVRDASLTEILDLVAIDPRIVDLSGIHLRRASIIRAQKQALEEALDRLERSALTAFSETAGVAELRVQEATLVQRFVTEARKARPEGRLVVTGDDGRIRNVAMEDGDIIVIPSRTDVVMISGEVVVPRAVVWEAGKSAAAYVEDAGGYTERADDDGFVVVRLNGKIETGSGVEVRPGDQVLILPEVDFKFLQAAKDVTQILFQVATTAGTVLNLAFR